MLAAIAGMHPLIFILVILAIVVLVLFLIGRRSI